MEFEYFHKNTNQKPERGDLLISEPFLPDPNFERSVVYLCEHDENGSFGFVLNHQSEVKLQDVLEEIESAEAPIFIGGPVERNTLHFLHRSEELNQGAKEIKNGVLWGVNFEDLLSRINMHTLDFEDIKFFVGYSGWSPGQLEEEINANSWIIYKSASAQQVFDVNSKDLWKHVLNELGGKYKVMSNYPSDPRLN